MKERARIKTVADLISDLSCGQSRLDLSQITRETRTCLGNNTEGRSDSARRVNRIMSTENIFDSPDGVIHKVSKEKSRGRKNPMIRPLQNNRNKICDLCCKQIIYVHLFRVGVTYGKQPAPSRLLCTLFHAWLGAHQRKQRPGESLRHRQSTPSVYIENVVPHPVF